MARGRRPRETNAQLSARGEKGKRSADAIHLRIINRLATVSNHRNRLPPIKCRKLPGLIAMKTRILSVLSAAGLLVASVALAADSGLPGDHPRPGDNGVPVASPGPMPPRQAVPRGPSIEVALKAAQTITQQCKQYPLGVAVVNSKGEPILVYIPDGSHPFHAYTAIRKAYTAVTYKVPSSELISKAQQDPAFAAQIKANPNLIAFKGGIPLKVGDEVIGAIGVSGAEPGSHDEECGLKGLAAIQGQLK